MQFSKITACGRSYHKQFAGYVCINEMGDLIKPHYVTEQFPKLLDANGLRRIRFHDLRHTFATLALQNGVDVKTVSSMLGHYDAGFTLRTYTHATRQKQDEAAQTMGSFMAQVM